MLMQTSQTVLLDLECSLTSSQIQTYLDEADRIWIINAEALDDVENDLQAVVNCAEEGDVVVLDIAQFQLSRQVILQRSMTISAPTSSTDLVNGIYPIASSRTVINCPEGDEAAFLLQTPSALLANLDFEGCSLDASASFPAIVGTEECASDDTTGTIQLHHVAFRGNTLNETSCVLISQPSCSTLEMVDVEFVDNECADGVCGAFLSTRNTLQNVILENNRQSLSGFGFAAMLYAPPDSVTTVESITATNNTGTLIRIEEGELELSDSVFTSNNVSVGVQSSCVYLRGTDATVSDSRFERNRGTLGAVLYALGSEITSRGCSWIGNIGSSGGAMYLGNNSTGNLQRSTFAENSASRDGGSIYTSASVLIGDRLDFTNNAASDNGAGFYCGTGSSLEMRRSNFEGNRADFGAATEFEAFSTAVFRDCSFRNNSAGTSGGVSYIEDSEAVFEDCSFLQNNGSFGAALYSFGSNLTVTDCECRNSQCDDSGGCIFARDDSTVTVERMTLQNNNASRYAGGIYLIASIGFVADSVFTQNTAGINGGGLYGWESNFTVSDSSFAQNEAEFGGATEFEYFCNATFTNCNFTSNAVETSGGVSYIEDSFLTFELCSFLQNNGSFGAALYSLRSNLTVTDCECRNSQCDDSGGCINAREESTVTVRRMLLIGNYADEYGGGIFLNASNASVRDSVFTQNRAGINGGGLYAWITPTVEITRCSFTENEAEYGAALEFEFHSGTVVRQCTFTDNIAEVSGGIVYDEDSNFTISDSSCSGNSAQFGGDFYLYNSRFDAENVDSVDAVGRESGGFIFARTGSFAVLRNVSIDSAASPYGGGIHLTESHFWGREVEIMQSRASVHGGALFANESSSALCFNCLFEGNTAAEHGGAAYLESQGSQLLAFQFDRCSFVNNSAQMGGALYFLSEAFDSDCSLPDASCTFLALTASDFLGNRATIGGGAILASQPTAVRFSCTGIPKRNALDYHNRDSFGAMEVLKHRNVTCPEWRNNRAGQYGNTMASLAASVKKTVELPDGSIHEVLGNRYVVASHQSGYPIPTILLELVDAYGQSPVVPLQSRSIVANMTSPVDRFICCPREVVMENGVANFSGVTGFQPPGNYEVRIDFDHPGVPPMLILVQVVECSIGQVLVAGVTCQVCSDSTYNFLPNQVYPGCVPCPDDALCDNSAIRPASGYWHQTPCSRHIQECMSERACDQTDRDSTLAAYGENLRRCAFDEQTVRQYMEDQCREGYTGVLCGSCADSYGRSRSFRCEPCYNGASNFFLVLLVFLMLLGLGGFTIRSNLSTLRGTSQASGRAGARRRPRRPPREAMGPAPAPAPAPAEIPLQPVPPPQAPEPLEAPQPTPPPGQLEEPQAPLPLMERYIAGEIQLEQPAAQQPPADPEADAVVRMELEKWRAVEIFKISVNYLQVLAVAISLNVNWTDAMVAMFEAAEFLGGVTSEAAVRSMDCLISHDSAITRSAIRTVVSILVPMMAVSFFAVFWALAMCRFAETLVYLAKRCLLSFLAVSYLTYIAITKTAVNVHYCVDVHDSLDFQSNSTTRYWAVDTSLRCYEGTHTVLTVLIGWPVLIVFSVGFPVAICYILLFEKRKNNLSSPWLFETSGFLYRSYRLKFIFWESVIMLRKAVLAVVVVFAYPLGGNLQGVLSVFVLIIALYLQIVCRPFRTEFDALNELEGLSLLVSSLTFVAGLFFNDDHANDATRALLSVFVFTCNLGLFIFLCGAFFNTSAKYLKRVLEADQIAYRPDGGTLHILYVYLKSRSQRIFASMCSCVFRRFIVRPAVNPN